MIGLLAALGLLLTAPAGAGDRHGIDRARRALREGDDVRAERIARRVLDRIDADLARGGSGNNLVPACNVLGTALGMQQEYAEAIVQFERALGADPTEQERVILLANLALVHGSTGDLDAWEADARELLQVARESGDPEALAFGEEALGDVAQERLRFDDALAAYGRAVEAYQRLEDAEQVVYARLKHAAALHDTGRSSECVAELEPLLEDPVVKADPVALGGAHLRLAYAEIALGDLDRAGAHAGAAVAAMREAPWADPDQLGSALTARANVAFELGLALDAHRSYAEAAEVLIRGYGPTYPSALTARMNLAGSHADLGRHDVALAELQAVVRDLEEAGATADPADLHPLSETLASVWYQLAGNTAALGRLREAREWAERAVALREVIHPEGSAEVASAWERVAQVALAIGDLDSAEAALERALAVLQGVEGEASSRVVALGNLGLVAFERGDRDAAAARIEEALAIVAPGSVQELELFTRMVSLDLFPQGSRERMAEAPARLAAAVGSEHPRVAEAQLDLAYLLALEGDADAARAELTRGRALADRMLPTSGDPGAPLGPHDAIRAPLLDTEVDVLQALGDREGALAASRAAITLHLRLLEATLGSLSEREQLSMAQVPRARLEVHLGLLAEPADTAEAWQTVLRWKGTARRALAGRLASAHAADHAERPDDRERLDQLAAVRASIARRVHDGVGTDEVRAELLALTSHKERLERELAELVPAPAPADPDAVCAALRGATALVDWLRTEEAYVAFVLRREDSGCAITRVEVGPTAEVDQRIHRLRALLASSSSSVRVENAARVARRLVWDPLEPLLAGADQVVIAPDGAMAALSFASLPDDDGTYLVERFLFRYVADTWDLVRPGDAPTGTGALVVGEVETPPGPAGRARCDLGPLPYLPSAAREIRELGSALRAHGEEVRMLTGARATESRVETEIAGRRLVHFASHGFFDADRCLHTGGNPLTRSGLVLSDERSDSGRDAWWTAEEVSSLDLGGTELVVLSACDTGLGEITSGEGVLGLRRAFALAGVHTTVVSLWPVPDAATATLMAEFYRRFLGEPDGLPAAVALREAQLALLARNRDELGRADLAAWGAFVPVVTGRLDSGRIPEAPGRGTTWATPAR